MKKIVFLSLFALCLPIGLMAQSADDDLYFVPSKEKQETKAPVKKEQKKQVTTNIYTSPGTTVVVQNRKGKTRDVDEYNRRYSAKDNDFEMENDTLYIKEKDRPGLEGEWVNGEFEGSQEDYEYAERIIRFRNPRFAISISSPFYWDMVYGANSWDWNVYTDGLYAYAFPTFSNPLWWDWRYNSLGWNYNWGWNNWGWSRPYYSWGWGYPSWGGWYGGYWGGWYGGGWGHNHWHGPNWGWGGGGGSHWANSSVYSNRRNYNNSNRYTPVRGDRVYGTQRPAGRYDATTGRPSRVVGTRVVGERTPDRSTIRTDATSSRRSEYTRPSSTRTDNVYRSGRVTNTERTSSTYNRGSSTEPRRSISTENNSRRSYNSNSNSSTSRSSSYSSGSSSSRSSSSFSSGSSSSSRSSGSSSSSGGGGGGSVRSGRR